MALASACDLHVDRLRHQPLPSHATVGASYPPTELQDVYARGQYGLTDMKDPPVHASVLVPLCVDSGTGELVVILTLRTRRLNRHSGEVALPGNEGFCGLSAQALAARQRHFFG